MTPAAISRRQRDLPAHVVVYYVIALTFVAVSLADRLSSVRGFLSTAAKKQR